MNWVVWGGGWVGILSLGALSSVPTAIVSEPPFLGPIFRVNVTPGLARNSRFSPSPDSKIIGVGLLALSDCLGGIGRAARNPQNAIVVIPIARRTVHTNTSQSSRPQISIYIIYASPTPTP